MTKPWTCSVVPEWFLTLILVRNSNPQKPHTELAQKRKSRHSYSWEVTAALEEVTFHSGWAWLIICFGQTLSRTNFRCRILAATQPSVASPCGAAPISWGLTRNWLFVSREYSLLRLVNPGTYSILWQDNHFYFYFSFWDDEIFIPFYGQSFSPSLAAVMLESGILKSIVTNLRFFVSFHRNPFNIHPLPIF